MSINEKWLNQLSLALHQQHTRHWEHGLHALVWTGRAPGSVSRARCEAMHPVDTGWLEPAVRGELTSSALYRLNVEPCECIIYAEKNKNKFKIK